MVFIGLINLKDIYELQQKAFEYDDKAKNAKNAKKYDEAAECHLKAAEIYKNIGDEKNWKFNCANYYSTVAQTYSVNHNHDKAEEYFKEAENLFIELNIPDPAFYCATKLINSISRRLKYEIDFLQEFIELIELFIDRYKNFGNDINYNDVKLKYFSAKSTKYRLERKFELSEIWAKECYDLAKKMFIKYGNEYYRTVSINNQHLYFTLRAKRYRAEKKWEESAICSKKAAKIMYEIDKKKASMDCINYYKSLAILNKYRKDLFISNMDAAIELSSKYDDLKQYNYLQGFKYDGLTRFTQDTSKRLKLLGNAKTHYYKAGETLLGKRTEYFIFYNLSKKLLSEGKYEQSIQYFDKTISQSKYVDFPNVVPSKDILKNERYFHEFYFHISLAKFPIASKMIKNWLREGKDLENTKKYKFYEILGFCCELLCKQQITRKDLFLLENYIYSVQENNLGLILFDVCSLTYTNISLIFYNIKDVSTSKNNIELEIIKKITTEEAAKYVENSLKIKSAVEEREWLKELPSKYAEKFDECVFYVKNSVEGHKNGAYMEFYKLIENFIKVIADFNARVSWGNEYKFKLETKIAEMNNLNKKPFDVFTFGDFVNSIKILKEERSRFCIEIPDITIELLERHINIRNNLAHELDSDFLKIDIVKDSSEIIYNLLPSFPTFIEIKDINKKPWYNAEILWNDFPKYINVYHEIDIDKGSYYAEPKIQILDDQVSPEILTKI
jgi:hypothetical protein